MLTDIFAYRYLNRPLWEQFGEPEARLLNQSFRIVAEQILPRINGSEAEGARKTWSTLHDKLCMELGIDELSPRYYFYQTVVLSHPIDVVCKNFVCGKYDGSMSADTFMKNRISFIELSFRHREEEIAALNLELPKRASEAKKRIERKDKLFPGMQIPGDPGEALSVVSEIRNRQFRVYVEEFNERCRRNGTPLSYHNGFVQIATDPLVEREVERPFWELVANPRWENVDIDMKEALDRRDSDGRDPAFYAVRALESTVKIISDEMGWTHGGEKGAHNYIDNLRSRKNGSFIDDWEAEALKSLFTTVRNPLGHGPGREKMPALSLQQTTWAIENSMSWIKSLVQRMQRELI